MPGVVKSVERKENGGCRAGSGEEGSGVSPVQRRGACCGLVVQRCEGTRLNCARRRGKFDVYFTAVNTSL